MIPSWHFYRKPSCCIQASASLKTHRWHHTAGADTVIEACPALVVGVVALVQHVLVATIIGLLVGHPTTTLHFYRVTAAEVGLHLRTVTAALIVTTLEALVFVEDNLHMTDGWTLLSQGYAKNKPTHDALPFSCSDSYNWNTLICLLLSTLHFRFLHQVCKLALSSKVITWNDCKWRILEQMSLREYEKSVPNDVPEANLNQIQYIACGIFY